MAKKKEVDKVLEEALCQGDKLKHPEGHEKARLHSQPSWLDNTSKEIMEFSQDMRYMIHNDLLLFGCDPMTINETKIIRCIIANTQQDHRVGGTSELPVYQVSVPELAKQLQIAPKTLYNEIESLASSLMDRKLFVKDRKKDSWAFFHWVGYVGYDQGIISFKLSEEIKGFFTDLKTNFTIFDDLHSLMGVKSRYSIILSESMLSLIKRDIRKRFDYEKGNVVKVEYDIDNLRWITSTQLKYKNISDFKKRVIVPAIKEINEKLEMYIEDYEVKKKGVSKISNHFIFYVSNKEKREQQSHIDVEQLTFIPEKKLSEKYIKDLFDTNQYSYHIDQIEQLLKAYSSESEFKEAFDIAKKNLNNSSSMSKYLLTMALNREKALKNNRKKTENVLWDTDELKAGFQEIVDYWNELIIKMDMERAEESFDNEEYYSLKPVNYSDIRHRKHYFKLIESGQTQEQIKKAIDTASTSSYFLRTSGVFTRFINPKNYFDIAAGERDYDSQAGTLWKLSRE